MINSLVTTGYKINAINFDLLSMVAIKLENLINLFGSFTVYIGST